MTMIVRNLRGLGPHGFHRLQYTEWGEPSCTRVLICAHGLTRNSRDFDFLAGMLDADYRVVCPDMPGRGGSDRLPRAEDYGYPVYLSDMVALIARLGADEVDWLGTSMGGLIGMMLAAQTGSPVRRLVLNDVGPFIPRPAIARIAEYVAADPRFENLDEVESYLRRVHAPFGPLSHDQWRHLAVHSSRRVADGRWALHYDPGIGAAFKGTPPGDIDLWPVWDEVRCPVLVLRGLESDLLSRRTAEEMRHRGPGTERVEVVEVPGVGHAPALMSLEQVQIVAGWLRATPPRSDSSHRVGPPP